MSTSNSFKSDPPFSGFSNLFDRSDPPPSNHKKIDGEPIDEFLWHGVCCYIGIKNFLPKQTSFYEYTWEVIVYMVITGKKHLSPNIWPKTPNQDTGIKDMILTI